MLSKLFVVMTTMSVQIDQGFWGKNSVLPTVSFKAFFRECCASSLFETKVNTLIFPFADAFAPVTGAAWLFCIMVVAEMLLWDCPKMLILCVLHLVHIRDLDDSIARSSG